MQTNHIHHLNYLVRDMTEAMTLFSNLFDQQPVIENLPNRNVSTARYNLSGSFFVLVQPLSEEGPVAEILKQRGEGIFLVSFSVDDLSKAIDEMEKRGIAIARDTQRLGLDDWQICDLEMNQLQNIVLQLCQDRHQN